MSRAHKKHLDFELNLVPFIDLLSVCICFLLMTAVWIQIGSLNAKQAVGGQAAEDNVKRPTMWVNLQEAGTLVLDVKDAKIPSRLSKLKISGVDGKANLTELAKIVTELKNAEPNLQTALIQPMASSVYEDIIDMMDVIKKSGVINLGVSPL